MPKPTAAGSGAKRRCRCASDAGNAGGPTLVDGQIDLAYETGDGWVVVEFKTDVEMVSAEEAYRQQVAIYVEAVARATGRPATGVSAPDLAPL